MLFLNPMPEVRFPFWQAVLHPIKFALHVREEMSDRKKRKNPCNCFAAFFYIELMRGAAYAALFMCGWSLRDMNRVTALWLLVAALFFTVSGLASRVIGWEDYTREKRQAGAAIHKVMSGIAKGGDPAKLMEELLASGAEIVDMKIEKIEKVEEHEDPIDKVIRESQAEFRRKQQRGEA